MSIFNWWKKAEKKTCECLPVYGTKFTYDNFECTITDLNIEYAKNFVLRAIIDKISTDVGALVPYTNIKKRDFARYLKYPNINQTWGQFIRDLTARYELDNEVYIYSTLNPDKTINSSYIVPKKDISNIQYNSITGNIESCDLTTCQQDKIHIKLYNETFQDERNYLWRLVGFNAYSRFPFESPKSKYSTVRDALDYTITANQYNTNYLKNGAQPQWALIVKPIDGYDGSLSPEQREQIIQSWDEKYTGVKNSGRLVIIEGGAELKSLNTDIDKLNFDEGFEAAITFCCMVAGIEPTIIGYSKNESSQYKVSSDARANYYNNKIVPLGTLIYNFLERNLVFRYSNKEDAFLKFDETKIPSIMRERYEVAKIATESEALTKNEIREMLNLKPVKDGDMVYTSTGTMPIDLITKNATTRELMLKENSNAITNNNQ